MSMIRLSVSAPTRSTKRARKKDSRGAIPKCGHVALVLDCYYVDICVIFSSSGSLRMRLISQFSRASGARFSETDDSPETVVGRWILPAKLKALLGSSAILSQVVPGKDLMAESKSPLFGIAPGLEVQEQACLALIEGVNVGSLVSFPSSFPTPHACLSIDPTESPRGPPWIIFSR